jgi:hypothetical protein
MSDLRDRYSLDYLISSKSLAYRDGWKACKEKIIQILKTPHQNADLSWDECDKRYIEEVEKLYE